MTADEYRILAAIEEERERPKREVSDEAMQLWLAACRLQDAGPLSGVDVGLALLVRDKLDAMLAERDRLEAAAAHYTAIANELKGRTP